MNPTINRMQLRTLLSLTLLAICLALPSVAQQAANTINTIAGGGATPNSATAVDLPGPTAAIKDAQGNMYIAAPASAYIFELTSGGNFQSYSGLGYGGFAGDGGPVGSAQMGLPTALTTDSQGNIYIADVAASRIRKVSNGIITTVVGSGTKCDISTNACGDGGPVLGAQLNIPSSIAVDAAGNIYIADTDDDKVRVANMGTTSITIAGVTIPGGDIQTIAGTGNPCTNSGLPCGDGGPANQALLSAPQGVALDSAGNIYIADTRNQRIRIIPAGSSTINAFAGNGGSCLDSTRACGDGALAVNANLHLPESVFIDASGNAYISDTADHRVRVVNASTQIITTVAGSGIQGYAGDGGSATSANLNSPVGIFVDTTGNILISDTGNQRIRQVSGGNIQTVAGGGTGGDGGPATSAQFANPYSVAEDSAGNVYVVDQANNKVRKLTNNGSGFTVSTVAGSGILGYSGDGSAATGASLNGPSTVAVDQAGNLYISDSNNLVIRKVTAGGTISTVAGSGNSCFPTNASCGDGGPATGAGFDFPLGVAVDSAGNIYIADYFGHRIRLVNTQAAPITVAKVTVQPGNIATIAGTGQQGNSGNGGPALSARLNHPGAVAVDSSGNVYISDQWNNQIRVVNNGTGGISAYALNQKPCLCGDGGPALSGSLWNPLMVTLDPGGNLFISGGNDNVVQRVAASGNHEYGTVAGTTQNPTVGGFSGDGGPATSARMGNVGSSVDALGNLYIADAGNNRVRYVPLAPAATTSVPNLGLGTWPIGQKGPSKTVTLTSSGGTDLNLTAISITGTNAGDFSQTNTCGTLPALIGPNAKCSVTLSLTPSGYGARSGVLNFTDNASNSPQTVTLSGSGPDYSVSVAPLGISVKRGMAGTATITLTPIAQFNQTVTLGCSGNPANSTCSISPNPVTLTGSSASTTTLTIQTTSTTPVGTYTLTISTAFAPLQHNKTIQLKVTP